MRKKCRFRPAGSQTVGDRRRRRLLPASPGHLEDVTKEALALADRICANAPVAVQESLVVARSAAEATEKELQALVMKGFAVISRTRDFQEGPLAFMEKREPRWTGE
jgi:enoyl-CoA hydratase/carnithine racemase